LVPQANAGGTNPFAAPTPEESSPEDAVAEAQEKLVLSENTIKQLTQSLANANAEAETYKRQAADLSLKLQALGADRGEDEIEQRLLEAVRGLRLSKKENEDFRNALIELSEAVIALLKSTDKVPAEGRMAVEKTLRQANELLGSPVGAASVEAVEPTLQEAMVVDVRDELSLIVANVGEKHGVKIGMPFQVWRDNKKIGEVRVVDVRDRISGAVVQNLENNKNPVKAGDRLRVDAQRPLQ
jgi:small-conductance mechanosensitive channel